MRSFFTAIALALFGGFVLAAAAQGTNEILPGLHQSPPAPLVLKSTYGADLYQFYCSSCHGAAAHGGTVRFTQQQAPDLTTLARQNNGVFPRERVRATIMFGASAPTAGPHGTADMPVWGTVFRGLDPSDETTRIRIENLVNYLASLQGVNRGQ